MPPVPGSLYSYVDNNTGELYTALFVGNGFTYSPGPDPVPDVPYTYMDQTYLYVVVFGNLQLSADPEPTTDGTGDGIVVFNVQLVQAPNPTGYSANQFPIAGLDPYQLYLTLSTPTGKIKAKPILESPISAPIKLVWPIVKNIMEYEFGRAMETSLQRIEKYFVK